MEKEHILVGIKFQVFWLSKNINKIKRGIKWENLEII